MTAVVVAWRVLELALEGLGEGAVLLAMSKGLHEHQDVPGCLVE